MKKLVKILANIIAVTAIATAIVLGVVYCMANNEAAEEKAERPWAEPFQPTATPPSATATRPAYIVEYRLGGTASRADITLENETGGTEQFGNVLVKGWSKKFGAERRQFVYISAQNQDEGGSIRCEIWVNGELWKEAESRGAYCIASCSGAVGRD